MVQSSPIGAKIMMYGVSDQNTSDTFSLMLLALFIIGLGFSIQQTTNPFVINLGGNEKGSNRLNLAGGINLGTVLDQ